MQQSVAALVVVLSLILTRPAPVRSRGWGAKGVYETAKRAYGLLQSGDYSGARNIYQSAFQQAERNGDPKSMARLHSSIAGCDLMLARYRSALSHASQSKDMAMRNGDCEQISLAYAAMSSIYLQLFDVQAATEAAEKSVALRTCIVHPFNRAEIALHLGWLRSLRQRTVEAMALFEAGIDDGDRGASDRIVSLGLHRLGSEALAAGDLKRADSALLQAYRIRVLTADPSLFLSRFQIAKLRLAQGDLPGARHMVDSAMATSAGNALPRYQLLHLRGRIRLAQSDLAGAVRDFRAAVAGAARWRGQTVPVDSFRASADAGLQQIYDSFIAAAVEFAKRKHDLALLEEAWQAVEVNRAASLRESILATGSWREKLPSGYWDTLAELRSLEARGLGGSSATVRDHLVQLRLRITELEAQTGIWATKQSGFSEKTLTQISLTTVRKVLGDSRTLMSFHLGAQASYCWTVGEGRLSVTVLPPAATLNRSAAQFRQAVESSDPKAVTLGAELYNTLLRGPAEVTATNHWLLALDGRLFDIPFAALITAIQGGRPQYLVEKNTIEIVPGAWAVGQNQARFEGGFVGLGDPIYNRADPRFGPVQIAGGFLPARVTALWERGREAELPRLVGSLHEIEVCSRAWNGSTVVLAGRNANLSSLQRALAARKPAVVHFATHFVRSRQTADETMIALSLGTGERSGLLEMLTSTDVYSLRVPRSLVVLSGCSSGAGRSLPGAGLLGLTRAFLAAGATGVIATHWPTPDDSGLLFTSFYRHLREHNSPAGALRGAQLEMLRSSSWRAAPRYWAAYQFTGRSDGAE